VKRPIGARPELVLRGDAVCDPLADRPGGEVERELSGECGDVESPVGEVRRPLAGEREHERRPQRVPRADQSQRRPRDRHAAADVVGQLSEEEAARDRERHPVDGQHEQHRDEQQLGREHRPFRDLELDARGDRVRTDEERDDERRGGPHGVVQNRERDRDGEKACRQDERGPTVASRQRAAQAAARLLDALDRFRIRVVRLDAPPGR
jgi:hypothetical protein